MKYDVIIVGAGPAGLFAAKWLVENSQKKVLIIDKGRDVKDRICPSKDTGKCVECHPCNIVTGVGGSGGLSDGKLNLNPYIGGNLVRHVDSEEQAYELIKYVDDSFVYFGATKEVMYDEIGAQKLVEKAAKAGVRFIPIKQKHIGSDRLIEVIAKFKEYLESKGVEFLLLKHVNELVIEDNKIKGACINGECYYADKFILAPGREGQKQFIEFTKKYGIAAKFSYIDVGVRVETTYEVMKVLTDINYDPKIHIFTDTYGDFVRVFCTNPKGFVVKENYNGYIGVNGHALHGKKSLNTNFAFLVRIKLTEPLENTFEYGRSIAQLATTIGGGKPVLQSLGDLKKGRRSTEKRIKRSFVIPTLKDVTCGDISMALPGRVKKNMIEGLKQLDALVPGIYSDNTLLYAPEIKYYSMKCEKNKDFMSSIDGLYVAGDGVGLSRDIVNSACTGILAAKGLLRNS
ncbi:NAD(P)/FAD-dependent oxidoreductase [Candidatus Woesearchaeota archaeon]|jgi:uncharacterized protein|nr:NAD(P)/FAD-dependent oxidoreductase [Candidatus Woesearchaeota archaeon]MBT7927933.1 NAD(P)/FAD-dependent oxidoreductase [Candidatus Woesearchaeota archaeon]